MRNNSSFTAIANLAGIGNARNGTSVEGDHKFWLNIECQRESWIKDYSGIFDCYFWNVPDNIVRAGIQCLAVIDELAASHSTDLQQRTYELQTFLSLNADVIGSVLPFDASCEDIEVQI